MSFDLNSPAVLQWRRRDEVHERRFISVHAAARAAMMDLCRADFFAAHVLAASECFSGDEIVEIFQTGKLGPATCRRS